LDYNGLNAANCTIFIYFMANKNVTETANVENVETAPQTNEQKLSTLRDELTAAKHAVRISDDETYDAAAAAVATIKNQIAAIEKTIAAENDLIEFNGKRTARKSILDVMIDAAVNYRNNPNDADAAADFTAKYDAVLNEWMAKFSTPPTAAAGTPRKQRATNGTERNAAADGKTPTTKPELTALYNDAVAAGTPFAAISADFYNRFPRSTVWHGLNDIKTGAIAVPQLANGHV
jgi:hypothetical protein